MMSIQMLLRQKIYLGAMIVSTINFQLNPLNLYLLGLSNYE